MSVFNGVKAARISSASAVVSVMESNGARKAMMSGSGPTVFGIFDDKEKMDRAAAVLRESRLAKTVFATDVF